MNNSTPYSNATATLYYSTVSIGKDTGTVSIGKDTDTIRLDIKHWADKMTKRSAHKQQNKPNTTMLFIVLKNYTNTICVNIKP